MRQNAQDVLNLYLPPNTSPYRSVTLPTADALSISWSPDGRWIGVFDSSLGTQQCHIYTADGSPFRQFPTKAQQTSPQSEEDAGLGFKSLTWSTDHVVLAKAQSLTFLSTRIFSFAFEIILASFQTESASLEDSVEAYQETINAANQRSYTTLTGQLITVPTPKSSIIDVQPNNIGSFLTCRDAASPTTLYLFNVAKRKMHSIVLQYVGIRKASWHPLRENLLKILSEDGSLYLWNVDSAQGPSHLGHAFEKRSDINRVESKWISQPGQASAKVPPHEDRIAILVSTKKAGFQLLWPEGQPEPPTEIHSTDNAEEENAGEDPSEDSLYDILTGRTPLPDLKTKQIDEEVSAEDTERLDDTFRGKREQVLAQTQAQAPAASSKPAGDIDDDSEIF